MNQEHNTGALPGLHDTEEVLGVPHSKAKSKTNVGKLAILGIVLVAFLFIIAGLMLYQKHRQAKNPSAQAVEKTMPVTPDFAQKNLVVESVSIDRTKAALKKKEEDDKAARLKAEAAAAAASAATAAAVPPSARPAVTSVSPAAGGTAAAPRPMTLEERKMAGSVLLDNTGSKLATATAGGGPPLEQDAQQREVATRLAAMGRNPDGSLMGSGSGGPGLPAGGPGGGGGEALASRLQSTVLHARSAGHLPTLDFLLKKGTTIPCALKTGIDTTLPGFVICSVLNDVYSANGKTLLIERGASVFGEQQSNLKQGQARTFVVWSRIDNPSGTFADIDSPATDQMGYSGIPGYVDMHFWQRFGGAIMLSLISDFSAAYSQRMANSNNNNNNTGTVVQQPYQNTQQTAQNMAAEALRNTINIPPTLTVLPATVVNVLVARDVSFEHVFDLVE